MNVLLHDALGCRCVACSQGGDHGAMIVVGDAQGTRQHQPAPAKKMQLAFEVRPKQVQLVVVSTGNDQSVKLAVEWVVRADVLGLDRLFHAVDEPGELGARSR